MAHRYALKDGAGQINLGKVYVGAIENGVAIVTVTEKEDIAALDQAVADGFVTDAGPYIDDQTARLNAAQAEVDKVKAEIAAEKKEAKAGPADEDDGKAEAAAAKRKAAAAKAKADADAEAKAKADAAAKPSSPFSPSGGFGSGR